MRTCRRRGGPRGALGRPGGRRRDVGLPRAAAGVAATCQLSARGDASDEVVGARAELGAASTSAGARRR